MTKIPYTEPDTEQVNKEAYQKGLDDAWTAARKITAEYDEGGLSISDLYKVFGTESAQTILRDNTVQEAIEKLRQYEQEQEEKDFGEVRDVLEETVKACNVTLDEIAEVLRKMKGEE